MDIPMIKLSDGGNVPAIGYGTYVGKDTAAAKAAIRTAIKTGYRYFDTASLYETERSLGKALAESGLKREEYQVATKAWYDETGYKEVREAFNRSLDRLKLDYVDYYFIHWPKRCSDDPDWKENLEETWKAMEELYKEGRIKGLGLSNFLPHHLDVILGVAQVKPIMDQLELHIGYTQEAAVRYAQERGLLVQAWSPIARGRVGFTENEITGKLAAKYGVSNQQIGLKFLIQKGIMPLPRAIRPEHMKSNLEIFGFSMTEEEISMLNCMPESAFSGEHPDYAIPAARSK